VTRELKTYKVEVRVRAPVRLNGPAKWVPPGLYQGKIQYEADSDDPRSERNREGILYINPDHPHGVISLSDADVVVLEQSPDVTIKHLPHW
jgi:hypothetical protein